MAESQGYVAWRRRRPRGRWQIVAEAASEADCWTRLYEIMNSATGHWDSVVLLKGEKP